MPGGGRPPTSRSCSSPSSGCGRTSTSTGSRSARTPGAAPRRRRRPSRSTTRSAGDDTAVDLDELARACPVPADASQLAAVADAVRGRIVRPGGAAGDGQVADDHQPADPRGRRGPAGAVRRREARRPRRRAGAARRRRDGAVLARPARQGQQARGGPRAGPPGARARRRRRRAGSARAAGGAARRRAAPSRGTPTGCTSPTPPGCRSTRRATRCSRSGDGTALPVPPSLLCGPADRSTAVRELLRTLPDVADPARPRAAHPWGFVGAASESTSTGREPPRRRSTRLVQHALADRRRAAEAVRDARVGCDDLDALGRLGAARTPLDDLDETRTERVARGRPTPRWPRSRAFVAAAHPAWTCHPGGARPAARRASHAQAQRRGVVGWFGRKKRLAAVLAQLEPVLRAGADGRSRKRLPELTAALVQLQGAVARWRARAPACPASRVPTGWNPLHRTPAAELVKRQVAWLTWAGAAVDAPSAAAAGFATRCASPAGAGCGRPRRGRAAASLRRRAVRRLTERASDRRRRRDWAGGSRPRGRAGETGRDGATSTTPQLLSLRRWVAFLAGPRAAARRRPRRGRRAAATGEVPADEAVQALDRGLAAASVAERRAATGLDGFDPSAHERTIARFTARRPRPCATCMASALPRQVLRARPFRSRHRHRARSARCSVSWRKQRGGLGVRALMADLRRPHHAGDAVRAGEPGLAGALLPRAGRPVRPGGVRRGVADPGGRRGRRDGPRARGRRGRRQQADAADVVRRSRPSARTTTTPEADERRRRGRGEHPHRVRAGAGAAALAVLALPQPGRVADRVQQPALLRGPAVVVPRSDGPARRRRQRRLGISLVRVDGTFHRSGTGKAAAHQPGGGQAVVAEIRRRFDASPDVAPVDRRRHLQPQQRAYIEALLRDSGDDRLVEALDDPRARACSSRTWRTSRATSATSILFSTAFSVNDKGVLPLNFGPLNRAAASGG